MLKLPRTSLQPDETAKVEAFFSVDVRPLWEGAAQSVSHLDFGPQIRECLSVVVRTGCFSQGLETIAQVLEAERKGLDEVRKRTGQPVSERMSRLLLISKDGSDRFYRQVASLLATHGNRVWCALLDATCEDLGALLARDNQAKAILINDKKALASFLAALSRGLK